MRKFIFLSIALTCYLYANSQSVGGFLSFDGQSISTSSPSSGDQVLVPDDVSIDFNSTDFTIEFWLKPNFDFVGGSTGIEGIITKKSSGSSSSKGYAVYWESTATLNRIKFNLGDGNQRTLSSKSFSNINSEGWMHIAAVFDKSSKDSAFLYINGELEDKNHVSNITDMTNSYPLKLMAFHTSNQNAGGGFLDDVRLWNKALTQEQIKLLRLEPIEKSGVNGTRGLISKRLINGVNWNDLVMYFTAETGSGNVLADHSNYGNDGTLYEGNSVGTGPQWVLYNNVTTRPVFRSTASGGLWSSTASWKEGKVPDDQNSIVFIEEGDITFNNNGSNFFKAGDLIVLNGRSLNAQVNSSLEVYRDLEVNGTTDSQNGEFVFSGNTDQAISGSGNASIFKMKLDKISGKLDLKTTLQVYGVLDPLSGSLFTNNSLTLKDNYLNSNHPTALIKNGGIGQINGTITIEKRLTNSNPEWRQICFPLDGVVNDLSGISLFTTSEPLVSKRNIFYWNNLQNGSTGNSVGWQAAGDLEDNTKAYSIYLDNANFPFINPFSFEGNYVSGDQTFSLTYFNDPNNAIPSGQTGYSNGVGWNFIPNPFSSLLDIDEMLNDPDFQSDLSYGAVHVWDAINGQYLAFISNGIGANIIPYNNSQTTSGSYKTLKPFEGFWVKTSSSSETNLTIKDDWRETDFSKTPYPVMKSTGLARLSVIDILDSTWSQCVINFDESSSLGFDEKMDAFMLKGNPEKPQFYTEADNRYLSINSIPDKTSSLPFYFKPSTNNKTGFYSLNLNENEISSDWTVTVHDKFENKWHNLSNSDYAFAANQNANVQRFDIYFTKSGIGIEDLSDSKEFFHYEKSGTHFIHVRSEEPTKVELIDISGRIIWSEHFIELDDDILLPQLDQAVYFIRISFGVEHQTIKFVIQ